MPTKLINEKLDNQRSISLQGIEQLGISKCGYNDIKSTVDSTADSIKAYKKERSGL